VFSKQAESEATRHSPTPPLLREGRGGRGGRSGEGRGEYASLALGGMDATAYK